MRFWLILLPLRKPQAPWREKASEARKDALLRDLGWRDEYYPERINLHPLAEIESEA
ncbi:MAG TPA: hypothetical protein VGF77_08565 [Allosphingosinicella sp.]|jgi:hypothetical protein